MGILLICPGTRTLVKGTEKNSAVNNEVFVTYC